MFAEQFLRIIAGLFVGIWVARYLGPEQFGIFSYALAFTAIFGGIAKLGLDGIMVRELVNNPENRDVYLGTAFWLKILGAFIVIGLMAAIVPFTSNDATTNLFIFIIASGLVFQSFEVVEFYFQSQVLAKIVSICKVIQLALSSIIKIYLVLTDAELFWFVLVTAFDALSLAVSYFIAYKLKKNPAFYKHFDSSIATQLLKDSWPLIISAIMISLYMRVDQIMIKEMLGVYDLGLYSAAIKLSEALLFIPVILSSSLFPAILNARKVDCLVYSERLLMLYRLLVIIALIFALLALCFSNNIMDILYGKAYASASMVLAIHVWSNIFIYLQVSSAKWYIAENLQLIALLRNISGLTINLIMNYILIPLYGIEGAAFATIFSYLISGYLADALSKNTMSQFRLKTKALITCYRIKGLG
ncbi:MAG: flippase [Methyloprofundus sp.]|nr:flippase [Methyloprofundus sp.]